MISGKPIGKMTPTEIAGELKYVARMLDVGEIGTNVHSRGRIAALMRRAGKLITRASLNGGKDQ